MRAAATRLIQYRSLICFGPARLVQDAGGDRWRGVDASADRRSDAAQEHHVGTRFAVAPPMTRHSLNLARRFSWALIAMTGIFEIRMVWTDFTARKPAPMPGWLRARLGRSRRLRSQCLWRTPAFGGVPLALCRTRVYIRSTLALALACRQFQEVPA